MQIKRCLIAFTPCFRPHLLERSVCHDRPNSSTSSLVAGTSAAADQRYPVRTPTPALSHSPLVCTFEWDKARDTHAAVSGNSLTNQGCACSASFRMSAWSRSRGQHAAQCCLQC